MEFRRCHSNVHPIVRPQNCQKSPLQKNNMMEWRLATPFIFVTLYSTTGQLRFQTLHSAGNMWTGFSGVPACRMASVSWNLRTSHRSGAKAWTQQWSSPSSPKGVLLCFGLLPPSSKITMFRLVLSLNQSQMKPLMSSRQELGLHRSLNECFWWQMDWPACCCMLLLLFYPWGSMVQSWPGAARIYQMFSWI